MRKGLQAAAPPGALGVVLVGVAGRQGEGQVHDWLEAGLPHLLAPPFEHMDLVPLVGDASLLGPNVGGDSEGQGEHRGNVGVPYLKSAPVKAHRRFLEPLPQQTIAVEGMLEVDWHEFVGVAPAALDGIEAGLIDVGGGLEHHADGHVGGPDAQLPVPDADVNEAHLGHVILRP